ncbi:methyltransferase family protein [Salinibius halmophilus]|uniref:methyltransferase family protein n=1 Tax=Salinibius halmophilus TaxID=1853216 RepID=UPI000E670097|nr:isoprenylcysteine carboxylmethyltransferase family protein [Salinibius halmophilus]
MNKLELFIPPPVLALIAILLIWLLSLLLPAFTYQVKLLLWLAVLLVQAGILLAVWAIISFFQAHTTVSPHHPENTRILVRGGAYRISRNPMYLALTMVLTGIACYVANLLGFIVIGVFVGYLTWFQIRPEERVLAQKFAASYAEYCNQVRRWV